MSRARPYASALRVREDSIELPDGAMMNKRGVDRAIKSVSVAMYSGRASHGYSTDYQRVETWWVEAHVSGPTGSLVSRSGWQFSGKTSEDRARRAYVSIIGDLAKQYPNASATFPTGPNRNRSSDSQLATHA